MVLAPGDVELFVAMPDDIGPSLARYDALLTDDERARHRRFVFERHRLEFLVTRALVRTTLALFRPIAPADWRFEQNEYGCPRIAPPCGLEFNLSNHRTMVVCAVTEGVTVGVDVEPLSRAPQILALAAEVFAPAEQADLAALGPEAQSDRAVALWTAKEAYIKARGMGLALPLDGFAFHFDAADSTAPTITFAPKIADDPDRWWFRSVDIAAHRVTLAVAKIPGKSAPRVRHRLCVPLVRIDEPR